jgi:hypothetical protein
VVVVLAVVVVVVVVVGHMDNILYHGLLPGNLAEMSHIQPIYDDEDLYRVGIVQDLDNTPAAVDIVVY